MDEDEARTRVRPVVGDWYRREGEERIFRIVEVDTDEGLVGLQYFDGDLDSLDLATWYELYVESVAAPEDWTGPMGKMEEGDFGYDDDEFDLGPRRRLREGFETEEVEPGSRGSEW